MMSTAISLATERCKGCQYCLTACPKKAIYLTDKTNQMGYNVVAVDLDKCIKCGNCYTVCPDWVFEIK